MSKRRGYLPQEGGDQSAEDQGQQNRSLVTLFLHLTLVLCKIFDSQIDLGYYKRVVPFPPDLQLQQNGAHQPPTSVCSMHGRVLIAVSFLFNWGQIHFLGRAAVRSRREAGGTGMVAAEP